MAVDMTLLKALGYDTIPRADNPQLPKGPYTGTSVEGTPSAGFATRNIALEDILRQLAGPSFENLYEAGPTDALARSLRQARQGNLAETQRRGLAASGARPTAERGALKSYAGGLSDILTQGSQAETARQTGLLNALSNLIGVDIANQGQISQAMNLGRGASAAESAQSLAETLSLAKGSTVLAATLLGGVVGGAGGAMLGSNVANSIWGGGQIAQPVQQPQQPGGTTPAGTSTGSYGYSELMPGVTGNSPYGPYSGGYQFDTQMGDTF